MNKCRDCIHCDVCELNPFLPEFSRDSAAYCGAFKNREEYAPVKIGVWIDMQEDEFTDGMWRCSACGSDRYFDIMNPEECGCYYCPNCGAKMVTEMDNNLLLADMEEIIDATD